MFHVGRYMQLLAKSFRKPEKGRMFRGLFVQELESIGIQSVGIVALLSLFMGAVICLQTAHQIGGWIPAYTIGFTVRQTMILEFSPTLIPVILAGKVGSNIASQLGSMRVTEEIDALEIMGVNSASHLILPKILAGVLIVPFLVILSMVLGVGAGAWIGVATGVSTLADFEYGMQVDFRVFDVSYALIKTVIFGFILTSVSAYHGYYASGGPIEVGRSSTRAVVWSVVIIMVSNLIITQMLLN
jgi:phospholipid/cholesterol/gamma-HCH transport system permease protein|tara:strand:+ start:284 stop:1012 length:729 start_codon:yes stop_codon:yes gene_type:complete